jgi:uncharacterized protein (UPF0332 family)
MKSESAAFLQKSREAFDKAQGMLPRWPDEAGRAAYLAGLHAAQALIFENTGKVIKRHRGVQRELARLMKDQQRFDADLRAFLGLQSQSDCRLRNRARFVRDTWASASGD